jgi:hypothetical protein
VDLWRRGGHGLFFSNPVGNFESCVLAHC